MIEKIQRVPLRDIWKHEATQFTVWLQENIDVVNEVVGFDLVNVEREQPAGKFNVDLVAEDDLGNTVIIENQLEKSDHDHLGKLITYLTAIEAKKAIWIVSEPRQEHINAVSWLNQSTSTDFYLLKVEGIKIGNSPPAALMTLIVAPSEEVKEAGTTKKNRLERHKLRHKFWTMLLEKAKQEHSLFNAISPTEYNWIGAGSGKRGLMYTYWVTKDSVRVEIRIDRGKESNEENSTIFDELMLHKKEIEDKFGKKLGWIKKDNKRSCYINKEYTTGGYRNNEEEWDKIHDEAVRGMVDFENAFKDYIGKLKI